MSAGTGTVWYPPEDMAGFSTEAYEGQKRATATLPLELPGGGRPNSNFRYAFKEGMTGWDVWALQVALNSHQKTFPIIEDGIFGKQTKGCVLREQKNHHLSVVDGIIGPATQRAIVKTETNAAEISNHVPKGLLYGIAEGESGLFFAAVSGPNWNGSYDAGVIQENLSPSEVTSISNWRRGFDLKWGVTDTAKKIRKQYEIYRPFLSTDKFAWYCAILYHNWPAAAEKKAKGRFDSWKYYAIDSSGNGRYYGVDDPAYWVISASGGRLSTAREWADSYVFSKSMYVKSWAT